MIGTITRVLVVIVVIILAYKITGRKHFWIDKQGNKLSFKQFTKRWKSGVFNITPLQQTRTSLISFFPIFAGILWGIAVTFIGKIYWMTLILSGSCPITTVQFISTLQRYKAQKIAEQAFKDAMETNK